MCARSQKVLAWSNTSRPRRVGNSLRREKEQGYLQGYFVYGVLSWTCVGGSFLGRAQASFSSCPSPDQRGCWRNSPAFRGRRDGLGSCCPCCCYSPWDSTPAWSLWEDQHRGREAWWCRAWNRDWEAGSRVEQVVHEVQVLPWGQAHLLVQPCQEYPANQELPLVQFGQCYQGFHFVQVVLKKSRVMFYLLAYALLNLPLGPAGPIKPSLPGGPCSPCGPMSPVSPFSPWRPKNGHNQTVVQNGPIYNKLSYLWVLHFQLGLEVQGYPANLGHPWVQSRQVVPIKCVNWIAVSFEKHISITCGPGGPTGPCSPGAPSWPG